MTDIDQLIERLEDHWPEKSRSAFDCANCGIESAMMLEAAQALRELRRAKKRLIREHRKSIDREKKLQAENEKLRDVKRQAEVAYAEEAEHGCISLDAFIALGEALAAIDSPTEK